MVTDAQSSDPGPSSKATHRKTDTELYGKSTGGEHHFTWLRSVIAHEMADEILQCSLDDFLDHYAPWLVPAAIIDDVHKLYVDDNERNPPLVKKMEQDHEITEQNGWVFADFEIEPTDNKSTEPKVFEHLKEIVDSLQEKEVQRALAQVNRTPNFFYRDSPYKNTASEISGTNFRIDAYLTDKPAGSADGRVDRVDLADIAVAAEYKRHLKNKIQNRRQLVADASQILNNDPRRTWLYGFTIENTMMSMWYFSRSHTVVSTPFDFTKDIKTFIHAFLSLMYATRAEIGYDLTVRRVVHNGMIQYVYEVEADGKTRYFKTIHTLFTSRVLCITGRKTRVWKAVEVEGYEGSKCGRRKNRGKMVALKDYWLDEGSRTEKAILGDIFCRLEKNRDNPTALDWITDECNRKYFWELLATGKYKDYFMGIECDMALGTTKSRLPSAQPVPDFLTNEENPETVCALKSSQTTDSFPERAHTLHEDNRDRLSNPTREFRTKRHYRLIYDQVGYPLHAATNLHSSIQGLYHTLVALMLLYLARYVHRDVSTGNIILVEGPNGTAGKLSDLEYAKIFEESEPSPDPKTGTLFFMAYEIHAGESLYIPPSSLSNPYSKRQYLGVQIAPTKSPLRRLRTPKFRFTHDLESLFWVTLFILADRIPCEDRLNREFVKRVFVAQSRPSRDRRDVIKMGDDIFPAFLAERVHTDIAGFVEHLAHYRKTVRWSYTDQSSVENMLKPETYGSIYDIVLLAFQAILEAVQGLHKIEFEGVMDAQQPNSQPISQRKRQRTQERHDDDNYASRKSDVSTENQPSRKLPKRGTQSHIVFS